MAKFLEIEDRLKELETEHNDVALIEGVLRAYEVSSSTIARANLSDEAILNGVQIARKVFIKKCTLVRIDDELEKAIAENDRKNKTRMIVIITSAEVMAHDTLTGETILIKRDALSKHADFFLPISGREKDSVTQEERLDNRIAERVMRLYNLLGLSNAGVGGQYILDFLLSLIVVFVVNDYNSISKKRKLAEYLDLHSSVDGSDFYSLLEKVKSVANGTMTDPELRYVDSRLFEEKIPNLIITREIRAEIIRLSGMHWLQLQIDNLGQILQSIAVDGKTTLSSNYTTSTNVHRLIDPLLLDDINTILYTADNDEQIEALEERLKDIYILDPACASGSFLATTWSALNQIQQIINQRTERSGLFSYDHMLGIDEDENALQVARISLFFAAISSSSNVADLERLSLDFLFTEKLIKGNGLLIDWWTVFEPQGKVYILGNPPYVGARKARDTDKRIAFEKVFAGIKKCGDIDYAGAYFLKGARYISSHGGEMAFVTTNSLSQGTQVVQLWPVLYSCNVHIRFAYQAFKWSNDARNMTAVTVVIIGLTRNEDSRSCMLYTFNGKTPVKRLVKSISPYLVEGCNMVTDKRQPISASLPLMVKGNMPYNTEAFCLTPEEKNSITEKYPDAERFFRRVVGSLELIRGIERWCLWIREEEVDKAMLVPPIKNRLERVRSERLANKDKSVVKKAERFWEFRETNETHSQSVVIPAVSSENYAIVPADIIGPDTIATNLNFVIYDCDYWVLGVILSKMHNIWIRLVCGGLETRVRYSETLGYNTFPFPPISEAQKKDIRDCVDDIIAAREANYGMSLGKMYKPENIPISLEQAHLRLDRVIDKCYRNEPFADDQERRYFLFDMYEKMQGGNLI